MCEESKENSMPVSTAPPTDATVFNVYQTDDTPTDVDIDLTCLLEEEAKAGNSGKMSRVFSFLTISLAIFMLISFFMFL